MCYVINLFDMAGVLNVVTASRTNTPAVGNLMCSSPKVAGISFTGKTEVSCVSSLHGYIYQYFLGGFTDVSALESVASDHF